jgi:hypothetical protein
MGEALKILAMTRRRVHRYVRSISDMGADFLSDLLTCCSFIQGTTGANRNERFFNFIEAFPPSCPDAAGRNCDTIDFVNVG